MTPATIFAFLTIYIVWGTTFLAIRVAVHDVPPLFAAGIRFFIAGILLYGFVSIRGAARPTRRQLRDLAILGTLIFVPDYAALFWAEKYVPSGVASLLAATIPLHTVVFEMFVLRRQPFRWRIVASTLLGFLGVTILLLPGAHEHIAILPSLAILAGSACFALGGVLTRSLQLPASRPLTSGISMAIGGAVLLLLSTATGELRPFPHISLNAALALLYLIVFGSLLAFTAYVWLLARLPATSVNSYAYVNPVVAVALGCAVAGETINLRMAAGAALVLLSVYLTLQKKSA
jgi:drug/metabolite transporter (DMT)-like permease